jgi:hypothetical protein
MTQITSGKIEYKTVRMLKGAYFGLHGLHERTEHNLHIDTVGAFGEGYAGDF